MSHSNKPNLRHYIDIVEGADQTNEAGPTYNMDPKNNPANQPAAPAGNSFDAKLAQANAAQKAKLATAKTGLTPQGAKPAATQPSWWDKMFGTFGQSQRTVAAQNDAKKVAHAAPTQQGAKPAAPTMTPDQQAARDKAGDMSEPDAVAPTTPAAPVVNNGPWQAGSPQADAYSKMSPEDQKWLGGADPLDPYILARAPNGGKPVAAPATPAGQAEIGADGKVTAASAADPNRYGVGESTTFQNDELNRIVSLVQYR